MRSILDVFILLIVILGTLLGCVLLSTWVCGAYFEKRYYDYISFYNLEGNIRLDLIHYQRGWFTSNAILTVKVIHPNSINLLNLLGIKPTAIPYNYTINQHIFHGPIVYRRNQSFPFVFSFAAIDYSLNTSDEIKKIFHIPSNQKNSVLYGENIIGFSGGFYMSFNSGKLDATELNPERKVQFDKLSGNFWNWPYPKSPRITGEALVQNIAFENDGKIVTMPSIQLHFNQQRVGGDFYFDINVAPDNTK